jgi:hypothetical protein
MNSLGGNGGSKRRLVGVGRRSGGHRPTIRRPSDMVSMVVLCIKNVDVSVTSV